MPEPTPYGAPGGRPQPPVRDPRAPWRTAFSVVFALSFYVLFTPGDRVPTGFDGSDKLVHAGMFGVLAATGVLAGLAAWPLLIGLVAYAGLSEVLQAVLPIHRDGDVLDVLADVTGVVVGLLLVLGLRRRAAQNR